MISRITKRMQVGGEGGFTLIELLVVIIIIAILAAIAIPMYLSQRQKGWNATMQSDLRNAAVAMESGFTETQSYIGVDPLDQGYNKSDKITFTVTTATATEYCLDATYEGATKTYFFNSNAGTPVEGTCPAA